MEHYLHIFLSESTQNYYPVSALSVYLLCVNNNSNQRNIKSGVSALSSTSSSFGTAAASTKFENTSNGIDDAVKAQALAEEEAMMNQFKVGGWLSFIGIGLIGIFLNNYSSPRWSHPVQSTRRPILSWPRQPPEVPPQSWTFLMRQCKRSEQCPVQMQRPRTICCS